MDYFKSKLIHKVYVPKYVNNCPNFNDWLQTIIKFRESKNETISETFILSNTTYKDCIDKFDKDKLQSLNLRNLYIWYNTTIDDIRIYKENGNLTYYNSDPKGKHRDVYIYDQK